MSPTAPEKSTRKQMIIWTDDEWDQLAEQAYKLRLEFPEPAIVSLMNQAQEIVFPKSRQRVINTANQVTPAIDRLKQKLGQISSLQKDVAAKAQEVEQLTNRVKQLEVEQMRIPSADTIYSKFRDVFFERLTPTEILEYFTVESLLHDVPVPEIVGIAARRFSEALTNNSDNLVRLLLESVTPNLPVTTIPIAPLVQPKPTSPKLPRVCVFGLKPEQQKELEKRLRGEARIEKIDKQRETNLPTGCDLYVVWATFVAHTVEPQVKKVAPVDKIIIHHGGITKMVETIRQRLKANTP